MIPELKSLFEPNVFKITTALAGTLIKSLAGPPHKAKI
ncbi:hypothetical protein V202x_09640 [Gimesia aquarii]|uniref:Uncharacterized protein n=1 Tax=Gimesia aquarii TaxID=2527964 RepID=A0A517WQR5_9PLAN|nr:hypothetical protein V202x_09640 [Gimesia aquarii]